MSEAARVLALLAERGGTLAVAESLTGGLVAAELTGVPGASKTFRGSVTAYATALKEQLLGVDGTLLAARGAVDPEVALQMAAGVRVRLGADWGIATTGVAGPDPQDGQPVGTVYVAVAGPAGAGKVASLRLNGDRAEIRRESVRSVLELLGGELSGNARAQDTEQNGGN
ncbi:MULTISPECIES: CinA family protein [Streptomyces]|uniref:Nicotinamide-nucleotide amidohydrolase family protein n=1 Tax=Streptomyces solicathayae TaxID=3081768 RepID=A0ABZ0LQF5_9ACTN|nr:nicotinamide-nucleotide amidohydrolase family protein [Streptomyces sp. HUAS YS2]WOX21731.1 nicotinamide-nucleotide amidohydrolase family protein [Streptomyces sp. HUAS YS2]